MSQYEYGTFRQTHLRYKLHAVEFYLNGGYKTEKGKDFAESHKEWLMQRRHETIEELNRVQLEEWNYD